MGCGVQTGEVGFHIPRTDGRMGLRRVPALPHLSAGHCTRYRRPGWCGEAGTGAHGGAVFAHSIIPARAWAGRVPATVRYRR